MNKFAACAIPAIFKEKVMKKKIIHILTAMLLGSSASVFAAVPGFINFQGRLLDASKLPKNVPVSMIFRICDTLAGDCSVTCQSGNSCLWTETQTVDVSNGIFAVQLGSFTELTSEVFSSAYRYLEIKVEGETLSPREQLASGPYSFRSSVADSLDAANLTGTAQVSHGGTGLTGGTSGGVPYYSGAAAMTSSSELTQYNVLLGGGGGAAPYALGSLGVTGQVLTSNDAGANPSWQAVPAQTSALLSATHTDTLAAAVVRGDIMIGNATPKWARLAKGAQYTSLNMGASDPAWGAIALDQSAAVSGILAAANGGTGSGFTEFTGPAAAKKTFTLPNASATILTTNAAVTVGQGGTGLTGGTSGGVPYYSGAAAMTSSSELTQYNVLLGGGGGAAPYALGSIGVSSQVLTSNGSGNPSWQDPLVMTVSLAADAASNNTTNLVAITGLDTTVGIGTYVFQYFIRYQSSAATTGVKFAVDHTGEVSTFIANRRWVDLSATASTNAPDQNAVIAAGEVMGSSAVRAKNTAMGVSLSVDTANADMLMIIEGLMIVTASGDLQLLHGSETAVATTVKAGTSLILTKTR
ncbi:MAG: hypothetical protein A2270_06295 [Elusimicrobia bacterium RIFOXYA12_FULL_51_18]|nr:MAG: hypothetical protein A2270_06295 [Elusimicrobia bacterium RIFOXYA12_FULL_51_18]OGS29811.1 MAG: hypothetical protein A2218_03365 [Elusimicrobia bacterium RIFOXYA2_FULL_53_38]